MSEVNDLDRAFAVAMVSFVTEAVVIGDDMDGVKEKAGKLVAVFRGHRAKEERERVLAEIRSSVDDTAGNHPWLHVGELLAMLDAMSGEEGTP